MPTQCLGKVLSMTIEDNKNIQISAMEFILENMLRYAGLDANGPS